MNGHDAGASPGSLISAPLKSSAIEADKPGLVAIDVVGPEVAPLAGTSTAVDAPRGSFLRWWRAYSHIFIGAIAVLTAIGVWQLSSSFLKPIFISTPSAVARSLGNIVASGALPSAFVRSLLEMVGGLVAATILGVGVGLLMGRVRIVERALDPLVAFGNATPSIALLPVMEVWFGFGTTARVAFITVIAVWPILVNTYAGVRAARSRLTDVGKSFGLNAWQQTWRIYFPATMPYIFVGVRISLAIGAVGMILSGQEIGQTGLGGLTVLYSDYSETSDLIAAIATTTGLAMLLFFVLRVVRSRGFPWIAATSAGRRR